MDCTGAGRETDLVLSFYVYSYSNIFCVNTSSLVRLIQALVFLSTFILLDSEVAF